MNRFGGSQFVMKHGHLVKRPVKRTITLRQIVNELNRDLVSVGELPIDINKYRGKYQCVDKMLRSEANERSNKIYQCI